MAVNQTEWNCPECSETETKYTLKIIPSGKGFPFPKWQIQITENCDNCGRYRRFAPQSPILVKRFNDRLSSIILPTTGRDFYE